MIEIKNLSKTFKPAASSLDALSAISSSPVMEVKIYSSRKRLACRALKR